MPGRRRSRFGAAEHVLVTGGAGYIGSRLVPRLLRAGRRVRVLDRLDFGAAGLRAEAGDPNLEVVKGDIRDPKAVSSALRDVDAVVHLAAIVGDPACSDPSLQAEDINVDGAALVARLAADNGVGRIVLASTCSVYGSNPDPVDESSALNPVSLYARSKIAAESRVLGTSLRRCSVTALRIGTAFGWSPRPRFDLFVNLLTAKARFEKRAVIFNGERWRPFIHVADIARGFEAVLDAPGELVAGETLNLGSEGENRRLSEVARTLHQLNPDAEIVEESNADPRDYRVRFDKIRNLIGFQTAHSLESGILEMNAMLAQGLVRDYRDPVYHNHRVAELSPRRDKDAGARRPLLSKSVADALPAVGRAPSA